jgi:hypothetical protein
MSECIVNGMAYDISEIENRETDYFGIRRVYNMHHQYFVSPKYH